MVHPCNGPVWVIDDFTQCFQQRYLQLIFPLVVSGLSILLIAIHVARYLVPIRLKQGYEAIPADPVAHEGIGGDDEEQDEDAESDLMLHKAVSRTTEHSIVLDRPKGRHTLVILEILGLLVVVGVRIAALATHSETEYGTAPLIVRLCSWIYILALVAARVLFSTTDRHNLPKLWNHTAALYGLQWLFSVSLFRSQVIHPSSQNVFIFATIEFSVSSFLLLLTVTTRKGNKEILVHYEDGLTPPKDQFASLISLASFSWLDSLVWQGYKKTLEISDVWNLTPSYQAAAVLMDFRQTRRTSILAWRLLRYFDRTLLLQGAWTMFSGLFTFIPTWLLKLILEYVEDPQSTPKNAAWLYVILLFCCGAIQGVADGQALWMGRRLSVKLRAIIIGELYAKALRRKAGANVELAKEKEDKPAKWKKIFGSKKAKKDSKLQAATKPGPDSVENQANIGKIINLMAIDSFKVSEICAYLHYLWASFPVQIIIAIFMLYRILGFSSFAGIALMILILPLNMIFASQFRKVQNDILASTDARIHSTNEVLQNIRIIKYFAWEQRFEDIINEKRRKELNCLRRRYIIWSLAATLWYGTPIVITFTTFFLYTVVEGKRLVPSIAFPALSMFTLLRVPLDQLADMVAHVQESKVSVDRVESFLNEEETEKYTQLRHSDHSREPPKIGLENATLSWGSARAKQGDSQSQDVTEAFRLINMNVSFKIGKLNVIAGPTGSGKTSLLMALLGEMKLIEGAVYLPGGLSNRSDLRPDPLTGLIESIAYCAQEAWLVNGTIKENILFASPFDEARYRAVIKACSLERDLEILDAGDQALVGEKGISLSGGQKQRMSLARALYSNARHLLLDDCLSAVDSHTARHIVQYAIMGPLMQHRTCILVTHNVALAVPESDYVVVLDNGKISAQGSPEDVAKSGMLGEELQQSGPPSRGTSRPPSRIPSNLEEERNELSSSEDNGANGTANGNANGSTTKQKKKKTEPVAEEKMTGSVKFSTIKMYLAAMGSWYYWIFAFVVFAAQQIGSLSTNLWIRQWANAYHIGTSASDNPANHMSVADVRMPSLVTANVPRPFSWKMPHVHLLGGSPGGEGDVKVSYYLGVYALLGLAYILISLGREVFLFWGSLHASWKLHQRLLTAVTHAKFKFFDSTPLGRLMNRFSKDIEALDQDVAPSAIGMLHCLAAVIMIVILISVITPGFLIAGVFITIIYSALGAVYLQSSRDLKRMESVQRSPLYQQFGETLNGVVTIRAYGDGARFILDNHRLINTYNRPYIYLWASNRWLAFRVDLTGALVAFFSGVFVILSAGVIDAGAAGLALTYAVTFTENILWLVRLYAENQQNMNSVERIEEYLGVEQEAAPIVPHNRPPRNWPTKGGLKFENYSTRYRSDLDPVLKDVSFNVQPGERVGIVGRTGAGKSSLALALFRGLEAETGRILIDDVDIGLIGLKDLREAITIVPQDPTLFTGTIRSNLDPFGLLSDEEIFTGLRRVHLIGPATSQTTSGATTPNVSSDTAVDVNDLGASSTGDASHLRENKNIFLNLQSPISESGSNLSQGQRQLLCLARAMLKYPKVLMMDEATASIDYATDAKIQDTLRELKDNTIITIAHRLQTIIDYDKVLVLDHGRVVEYDGPWQLINKEGGLFRSMCESSGNMENLLEGAKKAWEQKRLVDDS